MIRIVNITKYDGGENAIFTNGNKSVSVVKTDYELFDVKADNGQILYTGADENAASNSVQEYLKE